MADRSPGVQMAVVARASDAWGDAEGEGEGEGEGDVRVRGQG